MPQAMQLFEELLADAQVNEAAYTNLAADIMKARMDAKLNQGANFSQLIQYAIYGPQSPSTHVLSNAELQRDEPARAGRSHPQNQHIRA